jgi:plasmid replication initiation protein
MLIPTVRDMYRKPQSLGRVNHTSVSVAQENTIVIRAERETCVAGQILAGQLDYDALSCQEPRTLREFPLLEIIGAI